MDYKIWQALGYKTFGYADQRDLIERARSRGWQGQEPSVLGTYSADVLVEQAAHFLMDRMTSRLELQ